MTTALDRTIGVGAVALASAAFSLGFVIVKLTGLPPPIIATYRLGIGVTFLGSVALLLRTPWPQRWRAVAASGLFFAAHQLLYTGATLHTSIAVVTLVGALKPLVVALVSASTVGERVSRGFLGWSLVAVAGVVVVVHAGQGWAGHSLLGDALAVLNLFAATGYFLATKRARVQGAPTLTLTACTQGIALVAVAPSLLFVASGPLPTGGARSWLLLALLALGPGNGHLLVNWALRRLSAALSSLVLMGVPLLASAWAHVVFGEPYTVEHAIGMAIVVLAIEGGRRAEARSVGRTAVSASAVVPETLEPDP